MNGAGGCDEVFKGETAMDIAKQSSKHFMRSTDEAHKQMRDMMTKCPSKEEEKKWWDWFNGEWEKKKTRSDYMEHMIDTLSPQTNTKGWLNIGWKLMVAYGVFFIVLSILVPLHSYFSLPNQPMMTFALGDERFTGLSWSQIMSASPELGLWIVFTMISMCAMMMGLGILILAIACRPYRQGERWAWLALLAATLIPFAHYIFISGVHWSHGIPLWTLLPGSSGVGADLINIIALVWLYFGLWLPRKELKD